MAMPLPVMITRRIARINHKVAEFIRSHTPADTEQETMKRALDIVESPWPGREERLLREWFAEPRPNGEKARTLIDNILQTGLEPFKGPQPLPPIAAEEIHLICWMAIIPEHPPGRTD